MKMQFSYSVDFGNIINIYGRLMGDIFTKNIQEELNIETFI